MRLRLLPEAGLLQRVLAVLAHVLVVLVEASQPASLAELHVGAELLEVGLALVDEAIIALLPDNLPSLMSYFYSRQGLGVRTANSLI